MKHTVLLLTALFAMAAANAQVYQYKDASGRTVYSDQPPPSGITNAKVLSSTSASPNAAGDQKSVADREMDFKKRMQANQEKSAKEKKELSAAADRKENCAQATKALAALESGQRVSTHNEAGERSFLDDTQRARETERARKIVAESCGK